MYNLLKLFTSMPNPETKEKSLLIVDDSILIIERLTGMLKEVKEINSLFTADNYNAAVKIISEKKPKIVLLDIQLPGKNGLELLKFIGKEYPSIKVIMISNQVSEYYQRLCKKEGAVGFIDKSKDFDQIPEMVERL